MPVSNSQVSLGELVRLAFPRGVTGLTAATREREARWVVAAGSGVAPQTGDVVLCVSLPARKELAAWAERGVTAVALAGDEPPAKADLPILALPAENSLRDIQHAALELIVNRQSYLINRGGQIYQTLARLSVEGVGLPGLAQAMSELTGKAVLVQDKRLQPLAEAVPPGLAEGWPAALEALRSWSHLPEALRDRRQAAVGGWRDQSLANDLIRLVCPIVAKGMARGYLSVVGRAGEIDALDQLVVEHGAAACALEMAKAKAVNEAEKRAHGDFVDAVLTGSVPLDELVRWAQRIGYDVEPPHAAQIWRWASRPGEAPSLRRLETLINQSVAKLGLNALIRLRNNEVVVFCAVADAGRPEAALRLAAAIHRAAGEEYPQQAAHCGLGRPAAELQDWKDSHREAAQSLSMAVRLHERAPLFFGDLSVYRLLFQLEGSPELESFCREVLGPLMDYEGSGDLLETLEAFCDRLGNLSQTAEKLFIHRNSLLYRMERIGQLAGIDMNNPDTRLAVHLALKIRRMLRPAPARKER
ncbi:MAG: helix-turn-helix domain-containing protein [Anaerolineales bacterium]|nr:helix-turn-helix domain-containing protein [Anaerolineales bacterium]